MKQIFLFQRFVVCSALLLVMGSCKGNLQKTEYQKIKLNNLVTQKIRRQSSDPVTELPPLQRAEPKDYPWEYSHYEKYPFITKEFFRCKGSSENPSYLFGEERLFDCGGGARHSLSLCESREFVYPILIDLLNYVQKTLDARVVITCGHRCPQHNRYSDPSSYNATSKHTIAAEVDFYVEGYEKNPLKVIETLMQYYQMPAFESQEGLSAFSRYTKKDLNVTTPPWFNKEVFIKLYKSDEGRDKDNTHPFPYLSIQVRRDLQKQEPVTYTWRQAFYNYLRY